jgi:hypothetical protein
LGLCSPVPASVSKIMPAATVALLVSSIRMQLPVARLSAYGSLASGRAGGA